MFEYASPESCGISSAAVEKYIRRLDENGYAMHSILMARGNKIFAEGYWKPFARDSHQRMNSVTKSFVGIAIGFLIEEGKLSLSDKAIDFFEEIPNSRVHEDVKSLTIEDLLTMRTVSGEPKGHWVRDKKDDRIGAFFMDAPVKKRDTSFRYDSNGSYILCVIVERLTGITFTEYLKKKLLNDIGFSEKTDCIKCPDGYSWGDSGLLCRTQDLLKFAKFVMNKGVYDGKRYMNKDFLSRATSKISNTNIKGFEAHNTFGYGYQIWKTYDNGFAFFGMGDQLVICIPDKDFIFICTADNQGNATARPVIMNVLYYDIIKELSQSSLPENPQAHKGLQAYLGSLELVSIKGEKASPALKHINNKKYILDKNPMEIEYISVSIDEETGKGSFYYKNKQGKKELKFAMCQNEYTLFPEEGYPDMQMNVDCPKNQYPCAVSAAWAEDRSLALKVHMTGKHLGGLYINLGFSEDFKTVSLKMVKNTNCFLNEYAGYAVGKEE